MNVINDLPVLSTISSYEMLELEFSSELNTLFSWMKPAPRPCFSATLLDEIRHSESLIESHRGYINHQGQPRKLDYVVYGSRIPGVFNLGGDLNMFVQAILRQDRKLLTHYAHLCVENQLRRHRGFNAGVSTIALVQGKALGGGFECALACDTIVAERSATMALPETLFNLFPGMGALSFLGRRVGLRKAEEIITSGGIFTAKELCDLGVVDEVVEDGLGHASVTKLIANRLKRQNTHRTLAAAKLAYQPVTDEEMIRIADVWVDGALRLEARDLKMMTRLVRAQDKLSAGNHDEEAIERVCGVAEEARAAA